MLVLTFFNAGLFNTGRDLALLGQFYAQTLIDNHVPCDVLFGPAYKRYSHRDNDRSGLS